MLTRSDCWEPIERRPFIHLREPGKPDPIRPRGTDPDPVLRPAAVESVIRQMRGLPAR